MHKHHTQHLPPVKAAEGLPLDCEVEGELFFLFLGVTVQQYVVYHASLSRWLWVQAHYAFALLPSH